MKTNCWEFKKCERELGGVKCEELGVCPASTEKRVDGVNGGVNGGRCCWAITGTLCRGVVEGTFCKKLLNCLHCDFYVLVIQEEKGKPNYKGPFDILDLLNDD